MVFINDLNGHQKACLHLHIAHFSTQSSQLIVSADLTKLNTKDRKALRVLLIENDFNENLILNVGAVDHDQESGFSADYMISDTQDISELDANGQYLNECVLLLLTVDSAIRQSF